jgi:hypothetical protein
VLQYSVRIKTLKDAVADEYQYSVRIKTLKDAVADEYKAVIYWLL